MALKEIFLMPSEEMQAQVEQFSASRRRQWEEFRKKADTRVTSDCHNLTSTLRRLKASIGERSLSTSVITTATARELAQPWQIGAPGGEIGAESQFSLLEMENPDHPLVINRALAMRRMPFGKSVPELLQPMAPDELTRELEDLWYSTAHTSEQSANAKPILLTYARKLSMYPADIVRAILRGWTNGARDDYEKGKWWPLWAEIEPDLTWYHQTRLKYLEGEQ